MNIAYIPSPSRGVLYLGPVPLRAYAFCIIIGVVVAVWLGSKRWVARGGAKHTVGDIAVWAVPFGLVGGRLYHVITDHQLYFGDGRNPWNAFKIWEGGLGIWGAIALGAVGAWIGARRRGVPLPPWADALAPGIALAQACGRWGNWFNQELYGKETTLPWGLEIDKTLPDGEIVQGIYHPTFLYESLWCVGVALLVIWADRRFTLGHGRAFALYVAAYTVGRFWIEALRIDEAHRFFGLRLNDWTAIVVFLGAVAYLVIVGKKRPGREDPDSIDPVSRDERAAAAAAAAAGEGPADGTDGTDGTDEADRAAGTDAVDGAGVIDGTDGAGRAEEASRADDAAADPHRAEPKKTP
ncbi:prolipoprotein diacylglyceryl transferase 1 [Kitasatospora herbaricolor]|uniref:prolipoprotein diacylglyceryl transferase n=1 Tax=Kitasatospora herbaricolor TaxID=68217 RepID=UPI0017498D26|nr:prolipoprotein diacylglyceryl transferase [Kitasatospora herbaricolor]MDQ0307735.1 prolipoprotein diacylglyceryl transferase [Kitasatospora herbaricolor]GGV26431.1 prolipoprotein diacylglyceryl transferase 1 [Kitasatospora herbaricolor]